MHSLHVHVSPRCALTWPTVALIAAALTLASCGDASDDGGSASCTADERFNSITKTCEPQQGSASGAHLQGTFSCVVTSDNTPAPENVSSITGAYNDAVARFDSGLICSTYSAVDGTELIHLFLPGATLGEDGAPIALGLSLTVRRADLAETRTFPVSAIPYLKEEYEADHTMGTLNQTRFNDDGTIAVEAIRAVARVAAGALEFSADSAVETTLTGTLDIQGFKTFPTGVAIGDSCASSDDCAVAQDQFCLSAPEGSASTPMCIAVCATHDDCAPAGGVCIDFTDYGLCLPPCAEDGSCVNALGCYEVEERESPTGACAFVEGG